MMKMKIKLNEAKAKEDGKYTLDEMYKKIDNLANEVNITKKEGENTYIGNNNRYDLACFGRIAMALGECPWLKICLRIMDVTNVGDLHEVTDIISKNIKMQD